MLTLLFKRSSIFNYFGFSLIEVMISITILAAISLSIVTIQEDAQNSKEAIVAEDKDWLQVETAFARFEWDISHIFSPLYYSHAMRNDQLQTEEEQEAYNIIVEPYATNENFAFPSYDAHPVPIFKFENKNTFEFFTTSNRRKFRNSKQSNYAWVRYTIEDFSEKNTDKTTKALVRYFYADNPFTADAIAWDKIKAQILLRNVENLKFEFWDNSQRKWFNGLDLIQDGAHKLDAVKVILEWLSKDNQKLKFERIFRPLFLNFKPENMYQFNKKNNPNNPQTINEGDN